MIQGVKKFSELQPLTTNGTERLPAIQNVGGVFVNGYINLSSVGSNIYTANGTLTGNRTVDQDGNKLWFKNGQMVIGNTDPMIPIWKFIINADATGLTQYGLLVNANSTGISSTGGLIGVSAGSPTGIGFRSSAKGNVIQDFALTPQTPATSSLLDTFSENHGTRPFPRLTTVQRDAIVSPANYLTIVNTDTHRTEYYHPTFGWHPVGTVTPDWGFHVVDEAQAISSMYFNLGGANGGTSASLVNVTLSPQRLFGVSTGVNTNGEYRHATGQYFIGSVGIRQYSTKVTVNTLSVGTDRYAVICGLVSTLSGLTLSSGTYFIYDEGGVYGTATASPNWLCVCYNTGGTATIVDSGIAVTDTSSALQKLEILDDGQGNNVKFYINSTLVATITTQVPNTTISMQAGEYIAKTTGTNTRILYIDYTEVKEKYNTPR